MTSTPAASMPEHTMRDVEGTRYVTTRQTTVNAADPGKGMTAGEISEAIKGLASNQTIKARVGMRGQIKSMTYETASGVSAAPSSS